MNSLSPLAWVAIGIIILVAALVNAWMIALLRNKDLRDQQLTRRPPTGGITMEKMQKFVRLARNPFIDEQEQLAKLSKMVENLKEDKNEPPGAP